MRNLKILSALIVTVALSIAFVACSASIVGGGKTKVLTNFNEASLDRGQGAVMMHAINQGGLIATRWFKIDEPDRKHSFTVYRSERHRSLDRKDLYDVVTVEPGTYVLYSIFSNCEEGLRSSSTDWDEPMRDKVASSLGMTSWLRSWKTGGGFSSGGGVWGGASNRAGTGFGGVDLAQSGVGSGPGLPTATCNLISSGFVNGRPALATVTVKAGELVYAGELHLNYGNNNNCETMGNWLTDNETRKYCGAGWVKLVVANEFSTLGREFILKYLGPQALERAVVRLAKPGSQVSAR